MRILGIDPGSSATGYGIVERGGSRIVHVAHGTLRTRSSAPLSERLAGLQRGLADAIREHAPERAVVEQVFVSANAASALVLGQARGALLAALGEAGIPVDELSARQIKKAVTGTGAAGKPQVQAMVMQLLGLASQPAQDAADALAAAICRAQMGRLADLGVSTGAGRAARRRRALAVPGSCP